VEVGGLTPDFGLRTSDLGPRTPERDSGLRNGIIKTIKTKIMKKLALFVTIFCFFASSFAQKNEPDYTKLLKGIDKDLQEVMDLLQAPGFAVAVVVKNEIIYAKGFGYRDLENKVPVDANTLFAIGSCTKAFTSSVLGQLRKDGKLSFEDKPSKHIPYFSFINDEMNNTITIKDMMTHRTGLPRHDLAWFFFPSYSKDSILMRVAHQEPFTGIREQWYYNNFMYLAQGVIAEKITEKSWEDNVQERFFNPLGMTRSNLVIDGLKIGENAAFGYELYHDSIIRKMDYYDIAGMSPAGSINSSVNEMSQWLMTWINGGKYKGSEILSASYVAEATGPQMIMSSSQPTKENPDMHFATYGYGWMMSSYKGHYRVEHGGNINGFSASTCFFPTDSIGIVVLANQNGSGVPGNVRNILTDRVLDLHHTDWSGKIKKALAEAKKVKADSEESDETSQIKGTKPSHPLEDYTGSYSNPGYGSFEISLENDSLFAHTSLMKMWFKHYHYDTFDPYELKESGIDTTDAATLKVSFLANHAGEISGLTINLEATLDPIEFKHEQKSADISKDELEKYVGEYEIGGSTTKFYLKGDGILYLFVAGQPEYELIAKGDHTFRLKIVDGFTVKFKEDESGVMTEAIFIQPNGTFKAERRE
jgi:CubicO group peptidase (beta-lactamase class C family)